MNIININRFLVTRQWQALFVQKVQINLNDDQDHKIQPHRISNQWIWLLISHKGCCFFPQFNWWQCEHWFKCRKFIVIVISTYITESGSFWHFCTSTLIPLTLIRTISFYVLPVQPSDEVDCKYSNCIWYHHLLWQLFQILTTLWIKLIP